MVLLTIDPGAELYTRFGHTALWVAPEGESKGSVYNFGVFYPSPGMLADWLRGEQQYWLGVMQLDSTLIRYAREGRGVRAMRLHMPPEAAEHLQARLDELARPENAAYRYDWLTNNCSTRPRDLLDECLGGTLAPQLAEPAGVSARSEAMRHVSRDFPLWWALHFALGPSTDVELSRWEAMYLPGTLDADIGAAVVPGQEQPLGGERCELVAGRYPAPPAEDAKRDTPLRTAGLLGCVALTVLGDKGAHNRLLRALFGLGMASFGLVAGLLGTLSAGLWAATPLTTAWQNHNLFFANPLTLGLVPLGLAVVFGRGIRRARSLSMTLVTIAALGTILAIGQVLAFQSQGPVISLLFPLLIGLTLGIHRMSACAGGDGKP